MKSAHRRTNRRRQLPRSFSAQDAARIAIGAFYSAHSWPFHDGAELLGNWMLAVSSKLAKDEITSAHYVELMRRWREDENAFVSRVEKNSLHASENTPDNRNATGVENA